MTGDFVIKRENPEVGYLDAVGNEAVGMAQMVTANGFVHWSGVVAIKGGLAETDVVGEGDVSAQLAYVLETIAALLDSVGSSKDNIVSLTMFTTQIDDLSACLADIFAPWAGENRPNLTCIGVSRLAYPSLALEIQGIAVA
jgi:2-iminobutanoate/2-iminopropanoate deaminase